MGRPPEPRLPVRPRGQTALGPASGPIESPYPGQQGKWLEGLLGTRFLNDMATMKRVLAGLRRLTWSEDTRDDDGSGPEAARAATIAAELAGLRERLTGVRGSVIAGADGFLLHHDSDGDDGVLHDLAALAAAAVGVGRQTGVTLGHGDLREATVHSEHGYLAVYVLGDTALLAVVGDDGMNVARLHLEARELAPRLAALLAGGG